jgi:hypothetical protein
MENEPTDGYVKIGAFIDSSGARAGAEETVQAIDKVEKKTAESGEAADISVLGNLRSVHHLVGGLIELGEGGTAAIGGIAAEGRVATEVFEGLLGPLAPILLILTTITQIAIPMFEKLEDERKKVEDGKQGVDDYAQKWKDAAAEIVAALGDVLKAQDLVTKMDERDLAAITEKGNAAKNQAKFNTDAETDALREQYIRDQANTNLTEEQRKNLRERFEAGKQDIKDKTTVNVAEIDQREKQSAYDQLQKNIGDQTATRDANQKTVDDLSKIQADAKSQLESKGLKIGKDKDGSDTVTDEKGEDEISRLKKESEERKAFLDAQQAYLDGIKRGPVHQYTGELIADQSARVARAKELYDKTQEEIGELLAAAKNVNSEEAIKAAQANLDKSKEALDATVSKLNQSGVEVTQASHTAFQAHRDAQLNKAQSDQDALDEKRKADQEKLRKARDNELAAQQADLAAQIEKATPTQLPDLQTKKAALDKQGIENKKNDELGVAIDAPPVPSASLPNLVDPQVAQLQARVKELQSQRDSLFAKGPPTKDQAEIAGFLADQIAGLQRRVDAALGAKTIPQVPNVAPSPQEEFDKSIRDKATADEGKIDATSQGRPDATDARPTASEAESAIKNLGPSKQQAQAAHSAVQELDKGHAEGAEQLEQILSVLLGTANNLSEAQAQRDSAILKKLKALDDALQKHVRSTQGATKSLLNTFL